MFIISSTEHKNIFVMYNNCYTASAFCIGLHQKIQYIKTQVCTPLILLFASSRIYINNIFLFICCSVHIYSYVLCIVLPGDGL
jgi:hypothetical protein